MSVTGGSSAANSQHHHSSSQSSQPVLLPPPPSSGGDYSISSILSADSSSSATTMNNNNTRQRHNGRQQKRIKRQQPDGDDNNNDKDAGVGEFKKGGSRTITNTTTTTTTAIISSLLIFIRKLLRSDRKLVQSLIAFAAVFSLTSIIRFSFYEYSNDINNSVKSNNLVLLNTVKTLDSSSPPIIAAFVCDDKNGGYESLFPRHHQSNSTSRQRPDGPVFLWGIPSTTSDYEVSRRKLLRRTYLNFYKKLDQDTTKVNKAKNTINKNTNTNTNTINTINTINTDRICSFHEWTCDHNIRKECQMIYVFFIGGGNNETGASPIMLNESITDFRDMLIEDPQQPTAAIITTTKKKNNNTKNTATNYDIIHEPGTIYLKIYENQFDGKMTTWFKFASLIAKEFMDTSSIDYIFKVDSDLLLLTPNFFNWFEYEHTNIRNKKIAARGGGGGGGKGSKYYKPQRIYGGIEFPSTNCIINYTFDHDCPLPLSGRSYMSGELNFVTIDLATYIASDLCPRDEWTIPHEDVSISNYIYSYSNNTIYHTKEKQLDQLEHEQYDSDNNNDDHIIDIISVNTSRILLLPNMKSDWFSVNIKKNPEILLDYNDNMDVNNNDNGSGTTSVGNVSSSNSILWGHSIKRGEHKMYLYWKINSKYLSFWNRYYKIYFNRNEIIKKVMNRTNTTTTTINGSASSSGGGSKTFNIRTTGDKNHAQSKTKVDDAKKRILEKLKELHDKKIASEAGII